MIKGAALQNLGGRPSGDFQVARIGFLAENLQKGYVFGLEFKQVQFS
jgi:hypothetical protein